MSSIGASAREQWGGKRPQGSVLNGAQDAFHGLLRASPLSSSTASTASSDSDDGAFSLKKFWDSAQSLAKGGGAVDDGDAMESGEAGANDDTDTPSLPLWRRKSPQKNASVLPTMSWNSRFKYFVGLALMALLFFGMSSIFLPLIMIRPSKFALSFTFGSICAMGALAMLKGPAAYVADLMQPKSLVLTTIYILTLGSTLYSCLVLGSYAMVVISSCFQLVTLGVFALSAVPGGNASLKAFGMLFAKVARQMIQAFLRLLR